MTYKLLALDVDGTLLRRDGTIHEDDRRAIRRLQRDGIPVTIATGRLYSGTRDIARSVGISGPVACVDGSHIVHTEGDAHLYSRTIAGVEAVVLRAIIERHEAAVFLLAQDMIVHDAAAAPFAHFARVWSTDIEPVARVVSHPVWEHEHGLMALVAIGPEAQMLAIADAVRAELPSAAFVILFPVTRVEGTFAVLVRAAGANKGTAVAWLAAHHGCALAEVVVVGDWVNDVPMFEAAGRSFVMGQAPEAVKQSATDRLEADTFGGGGVAEAIARAFGR